MCHGVIYGRPSNSSSSSSRYYGGASTPKKVRCTKCWKKVERDVIARNLLRTIYKCPSCKENFMRKSFINKTGKFLLGAALAHIGGDILHDNRM